MTERSKGYWQRHGAGFADFYGGTGRRSPRRLVSRFLEARTARLTELAGIGPRDEVLDLGCGSGVHMKMFAPLCERIVGLDLSSGMIAKAEEELAGVQAANWELRVGDAHDLPFSDGSFSWVISMGLLDYVSSPQRVLEECRRVLRESGRIVFTMPKSPSPFFLLRTAAGNVLRDRLFGLPPIANTASYSRLMELLHAAGLAPESAQTVWGAMWIVLARKERDDSHRRT
jgi:ubiquinone/menaquinone biosynthesis C-methylase UbiE